MAHLNYAPTKTNLIALRGDLAFARQGYELLDQKRKILILELLGLVDQTVEMQNRIEHWLAEAHGALGRALLEMGTLRVHALSSAVNIQADLSLGRRRVMGVILPVVETAFTEKAPYYSPMGTSFHVDESVQAFKETLRALGKFAELKISVLRLAREVRKTIRKVNALEKIAIPDLRETVTYIQYRLEENEREMFMMMKMVKERLQARTDTGEEHGEQPD